MEIRIREGENLVCEISGNAENTTLIKMIGLGGDPAKETPWMGEWALTKALKIIAPFAAQPAQPYQNHIAAPQPQIEHQPAPVATARPPMALTPAVQADLKLFEGDLVDMMNDPPAMRDGKPADGLSEAEIRRLIGDHQNRFQDPNALFPILRKHLGMEKGRFDMIIESNRKSRAR